MAKHRPRTQAQALEPGTAGPGEMARPRGCVQRAPRGGLQRTAPPAPAGRVSSHFSARWQEPAVPSSVRVCWLHLLALTLELVLSWGQGMTMRVIFLFPRWLMVWAAPICLSAIQVPYEYGTTEDPEEPKQS